MLHAAPTSETKADTVQSKAQVVPQPERELHPHVLSTTGRYSSSGMSGIASGASPNAQRRQALAGMQSTQGNQAVLRMLHSPQQVARMTALRPSQGIMLQRKCACGGSSETEGECAECKAKREGTLQRRAANPTVSSTAGVIQTKLAINQPGDQYEQEADRIADQVMTTPAQHAVSGTLPRIQRFSGKSSGQMDEAPASVDQALANPGRPLEPGLRQDMEQRFGYDFSNVRVHSDANAKQSARDVSAHAYTVGHHIVFGEGRFASGTPDDRRLIAHELAHVVQQSGGEDTRSLSLQRQPSPPPTRQRKTRSPKETNVGASDMVRELERVGDAWHLTLQGFTEAGAVASSIWPSRLPPGVRIVPLVVVEEPVQMGVFELEGVTYDALETMVASYAKWFFDLGLHPPNPPSHALHTIRLWFKAFIPQALLRAPGFDCFKGDNRSYSSDLNAPARMTSEVLLTNLHTAAPTLTQTHWCGLTRQVDCDSEAPIDSATANTSGMRFYNFRYPGAVVFDWNQPYPPAARPPEITVGQSEPLSLDYIGAAADPLVPVAPFIDISAHIELDLLSGFLTVNGKADDYPAFEGYVTVNEKQGPFNIFALDGDDWVISLIGGANRPFSQRISLGSYAAIE